MRKYRTSRHGDEFIDDVQGDGVPTTLLVATAREMRQSEWWTSVPTYEAPAPVAGEIEAR
jgi:hypothetical protein